MGNIFFTSDHHFGHANIIRFCNRPFDTVEEMDREMIRRWNEKIQPHDTVYHLGDFALNGAEAFTQIAEQLNGTIHLIAGNHEASALNNRKRFAWIKDYYELKVKDADCPNGVQRIVLLHYAMRTWRGAHHGTWHLYGHSHNTLADWEDALSFDVGVDCHDFYPLSYEEVKAIMQRKNWIPPFGDNER